MKINPIYFYNNTNLKTLNFFIEFYFEVNYT